MGVYVVKQEAPWWQKLLSTLATSAGTGLISGMFERDKMARQSKLDEAKAAAAHDRELEKLGVQADYAASQKQKDFDNQLQLANLNNEHSWNLANLNNQNAMGLERLRGQNARTLAGMNNRFTAGQNDLNRGLEREKLAQGLRIALGKGEQSALNTQQKAADAQQRAADAQARQIDEMTRGFAKNVALYQDENEIRDAAIANYGPELGPLVYQRLQSYQLVPGAGGFGSQKNLVYQPQAQATVSASQAQPVYRLSVKQGSAPQTEQAQAAEPAAQAVSQDSSFSPGDSLSKDSSFKKGGDPFTASQDAQPQVQPQTQKAPAPQAPRTPASVAVTDGEGRAVTGGAVNVAPRPQGARVSVSNSPVQKLLNEANISPQTQKQIQSLLAQGKSFPEILEYLRALESGL